MANNGGSRSPASNKISSLVLGILIGMFLGILIAILVAWLLLKSPNPFAGKDSRETQQPTTEAPKPAQAKAAPAQSRQGAASTTGSGKPRFEFYKVLTDKRETAAPAQKGSGKTAASQPAVKESYLLQAGAFSAAEDADKLKAKLAMLGMEAVIQEVAVPEKGVLHRVRLGPYKNVDEMNKALAVLKQNDITATQIRAQ